MLVPSDWTTKARRRIVTSVSHQMRPLHLLSWWERKLDKPTAYLLLQLNLPTDSCPLLFFPPTPAFPNWIYEGILSTLVLCKEQMSLKVADHLSSWQLERGKQTFHVCVNMGGQRVKHQMFGIQLLSASASNQRLWELKFRTSGNPSSVHLP